MACTFVALQEAHLTKIKALFSKFGVDDEGDEETAHITFPMFLGGSHFFLAF